MNEAAPATETVFAPREFPLVGDLYSYLAVLAQRAPGTIAFRTGAGRIFRDLLIHWPALDEWEDEAQELCQRITDAVYPLTGALYAQAVEMAITISATPISAPPPADAMATYVMFDIQEKNERHYFLAPKQPMPQAEALSVGKGVAVLCRPLNYRYHTIKDDRGRTGHPHAGIFELSERLINELYGLADYTPRDGTILNKVKTDLKQLPKLLEQNETSRDANLALETHHLTPQAPVIAMVTSLSGLPAPVRAMERRLMTYVTDKSVAPALRVGFRKLAQNLRNLYPQTIISEAAHFETAPLALKKTKTAPNPAPRPQPKAETKPQPAQISRTPVPRLVPVPLSIHPSLVLPTASPVPSFLQRQAVVPAVTARASAPQPAPRPAQPRPATVQRRENEAVRPETPQPETRPNATRQAEPQARPSQPRAAATGPDARPTVRPTPVQQRVREAMPRPEPAKSASPQPVTAQARQTKAAVSRPSVLEPQAKPVMAQQPMRQPQPQPAIRQPQSRQTVRPMQPPPQPREKSQAAQASYREEMPAPLEKFSVSATRHFDEMESRPQSFYARLKATAASPFPKAIPVSGVGKLDKITAPILAKNPALPKTKLPVLRPHPVLPAPGPSPLSPFFWFGK